MGSEDIGFGMDGGAWSSVECEADGCLVISAGEIYVEAESHYCRLSREEGLALLEFLKRKLEGNG